MSTAYLIEREEPTGLFYWAGVPDKADLDEHQISDWTRDANSATRFADRGQAGLLAVLIYLITRRHARKHKRPNSTRPLVREHEWLWLDDSPSSIEQRLIQRAEELPWGNDSEHTQCLLLEAAEEIRRLRALCPPQTTREAT